ncbi:hypothetical protein LTR62_008392 [Meristemomyces frigidus]|uniref:NADH:flavin oxidoreductase/NADH oxidase N-terminal domain-containing protein n=1 Tax=Meristemomyces frigidus TaxID=1508187 RepID=A0AAN7T9Y6_9PEZI|nr:hypothetical protein LTR62_008392 [Meristemomyces frigidus]
MEHVPGKHMVEYYEQRASCAGTLLITEATFISPQAGGYNNVPGIWNSEQVAAWKPVVDAVHAKGSFIYLQLWALGRAAGGEPSVKNLQREGPYPVVSASTVAINSEFEEPHALSESEVQEFVGYYANAAKNAMEAGFDGVEIHGANGYLIDQFWQDVSNRRTDNYGGSIENRARFGLEVTKAVIEACGNDSKKVGMRLSPWSTFQSMGMQDPIPQFSHIIRELKKLNLAYLHLVESRTSGKSAVDAEYATVTGHNDELAEIWGTEAPLILAGGFDAEKSIKAVEEVYTKENIVIAYGRYFISTPDLPFRVQHGIPFTPYDRKTFYKAESPEGYIDYPFCKEFLGQESRL